MSAWLCTEYHIGQLAIYATKAGAGDNAADIAETLAHQNILSLDHRYEPGDFLEDAAAEAEYKAGCRTEALYGLHDPRAEGTNGSAFKAQVAQCYSYQACETDDYYSTEAAKLVRWVLEDAARALPGHDAAPWGIERPDNFKSPSAGGPILLSSLFAVGS